MKRQTRHLCHHQSGAVLLMFILLLVVGSSYMLLDRLNAHVSNDYYRDTITEKALLQAKKALISYAMNYPDLRNNSEKGPGFLPCPDQDDDGDPESGCSINTPSNTGRIPWRILGLPDLRDSDGARLWYALSDNFKNTQSNDTVINSETPGQIVVDGVDDIVAVIIAPGGPTSTQTARPSNTSTDYLEDDNASMGDNSFVTSAAVEFNDNLITITRQELMKAVEKRVIAEVSAILEQYYVTDSANAYPWLATFADPKADSRILRGTHTGSDNAAVLTDSGTDFTKWGVKKFDIVRNVTDGSLSIVTDKTATTVTVTNIDLGNASNDND
ncbi:MAG: hypothetical protein V3R68_02115, partial [Gammaproteobacteria bacterium]